MNGQGIHHVYVETRSWEASLEHFAALGFTLADGFGENRDGILHPPGPGPYVFLREVDATVAELAYDVIFGAEDLRQLSEGPGVEVARKPYEQHWGPIWMDIRDPDGLVRSVREQEK